MDCLQVVVFRVVFRTLFVPLEILHNLVFVQMSCLEKTAEVGEISQGVQREFAFILNLLSETVNAFAETWFFL